MRPDSDFHGARPVHQIISMPSRLSINKSLYCGAGRHAPRRVSEEVRARKTPVLGSASIVSEVSSETVVLGGCHLKRS